MRTAPNRGRTPEEDEAMGCVTHGIITEVDGLTNGNYGISYRGLDEPEDRSGGWGCGLRDVGVEPKIGDRITIYGRFGRRFHGQALNGNRLWYETPEEEEEALRREQDAHDAKQRADFEEERSRLDADYESLPDVFRARIDRFRAGNPDFRWEFESYEMGVCVDAVRIAEWYGGRFDKFSGKTVSDVAAEVEGLFEGHSGNSLACAVHLAGLFILSPPTVVIDHGAMTPLVGCEAYGCTHPEEET